MTKQKWPRRKKKGRPAGKAKAKAKSKPGRKPKAKARAKAKNAAKKKPQPKPKPASRKLRAASEHEESEDETNQVGSQETMHYSPKPPAKRAAKAKAKAKEKAKTKGKGKRDPEVQRKARLSRKTSAYHCAKSAALKAGDSAEEATKKAKQATLHRTGKCSIVPCMLVYSTRVYKTTLDVMHSQGLQGSRVSGHQIECPSMWQT